MPGKEDFNTEFYNGVIVPGFVNAHCHLELSYLKSQFSEGCGLTGFIEQMRGKRNNQSEKAGDMAELYDAKMYREGISVAADIVNTPVTSEVKKKSRIHYINFIELFGLKSEDADKIRARAESLAELYQHSHFTPHALYSLSDELKNHLAEMMKNQLLGSLHYFESQDEEEYYQNHTGTMADALIKLAGKLPSHTGGGRWDDMRLLFHKQMRLLLVHNTFTPENDEEELARYFSGYYRVLCPGSNYFISRKMPVASRFDRQRICLGTDSLASGHDLNMLNEIRMMMQSDAAIKFSDVLMWATLNGASALNVQKEYGSIEPGKKPGLVLIEQFDFRNERPGNASFSRRLV